MLVALRNVPRRPDQWQEWSWHHRQSHDSIRLAVRRQLGIDLVDYQIEPISPQDIQGFLQRNSQLHIEMNAVLKAQTIDLEDADLSDDRQKEAWVYLHFLEHQTAEQKLGI